MTTLEALIWAAGYIEEAKYGYNETSMSFEEFDEISNKLKELYDLLESEMNKPKKESLIPAIDLTQEDARQVLYNLAQKNLLTKNESEGK